MSAKRKGREKVHDWKVKKVKEMVDILKGSPVVALADLKGMPTSNLNSLRHNLRGEMDVIFTKKNLVLLALKKLGWEELSGKVGDMPALIISKHEPFKFYSLIYKNRAPAFAKPGQISPDEIMIPKGPTPVPAGPALGEFQKAGLPARIQEGKIGVLKDTVVAKKGDPINEDVAAILQKLDIKPIEIILNVLAVKEGTDIYTADILRIDYDEVFSNFVTAHSSAFNLAYQVKYPCSDTVELFILEAHQQAQNLAISEAIYEPDVIEQILAMANTQAHQLGGEEVEYVYAAMLLHKSGQKVDEKSVTKVLEAAGSKADSARVKALVAALEGVNIEEAIKKAPAMAAAPAPAAAPAAEGKKKEKTAEDEKKSEEEAASGLAALFG